MRTRTSGENTRVSKKELRYATQFMSNILMSRQMCKNLSIRIHSVSQSTVENDYHGTCDWMDDSTKPRSFKITLAAYLNRKSQLVTLAHELAHVKQYATGELKDMVRGPGQVKWKKSYMNPNDADSSYWLLPWEIEARGYEAALTQLYSEHLKEVGIKFKKA